MGWAQRTRSFPGFGSEEGTAAEGDDGRIVGAMVVVHHGDDALYPAPPGPARYWIGSAEPVNALDGDLWLEALLPAPP